MLAVFNPEEQSDEGSHQRNNISEQGLPQTNPWSEEVKSLIIFNPVVYSSEDRDANVS